MNRHPIRLVVTDDLRRWRLTVFFRLLLAIPHYVWLALWTVGAVVAAFLNWLATFALGRSPRPLHNFLAAYVRYVTHVYAYLYLVADPYPGFTGAPGSYPIDLEIDPPAPQRRWTAALRIVLAFPALLLSSTMTSGGWNSGGRGAASFASGPLGTVSFFAWFACLVRGRMPSGFRDLSAYLLGYTAQAFAYLLLLTDRYPNSDPAALGGAQALPAHPIRMAVDDDLRRSRVTVFFRLLLALPHFVWLMLWGVAALLATVANWLATLAAGRSPQALHRFLTAYTRYQTHVLAYLFLIGNPFPGFSGERYPIDLEIDAAARQSRWATGVRLPLALPALIVSGALGSLLYVVAFLGWFAALAVGRMPEGLRNLGTYALRYSAQVYGYLYLLTDRYPYSGPPATSPSGDDASWAAPAGPAR